MRKLRPITIHEWEIYEWAEVTILGDEGPVFLKSFKKSEPPEDGLVYVLDTRLGDSEQRWVKAMTPEDD